MEMHRGHVVFINQVHLGVRGRVCEAAEPLSIGWPLANHFFWGSEFSSGNSDYNQAFLFPRLPEILCFIHALLFAVSFKTEGSLLHLHKMFPTGLQVPEEQGLYVPSLYLQNVAQSHTEEPSGVFLMHKRGKEESRKECIKKWSHINSFIPNDLFNSIMRKTNSTCKIQHMEKEQKDELGMWQGNNKTE